MRFEIFRLPAARARALFADGGNWCWRLCDDDCAVVAFGEGYRTRADCRRAVNIVRGTTRRTPVIEENEAD